MRTEPENGLIKVVEFKEIRKPKSHRNTTNHVDEAEANFIRRLKRGKGKYQGILPFKCFKCGIIGHFDSKCTYEENQESRSGEESEYQKQKN